MSIVHPYPYHIIQESQVADTEYVKRISHILLLDNDVIIFLSREGRLSKNNILFWFFIYFVCNM